MAGYRILRDAEAFALDPSDKRQKRIEDPRHLAFIRSLPSVLTGVYGCEAAHISAGSPLYRKKRTGMAQKADDAWTLPLLREEHAEQHAAGDELGWWRSKGIADPFAIALGLYDATGDREAAITILRNARNRT